MKLILYRANCLDGVGAALAAWLHFKNSPEKMIYITQQVGEKIRRFKPGADLYLLNLAYSPEQIAQAAKTARSITLIDHHKMAEDQHKHYWLNNPLPENVNLIMNQAHSSCALAWAFFHPDKPMPFLLEVIEDRDLRLFKNERTKAITLGLYHKMPISIEALNELTSPSAIKAIEKDGQLLLNQSDKIVSRLKSKKHHIFLGEKEGLAVNAPAQFSSELGDELANESKTFGATYQYLGEKPEWLFNIRSVGDYDVGELARSYGGRGSKNSAVFSLSHKQFAAIFVNEYLAKEIVD